MGAVYRLAMREDASCLYDIRRRSILELAPATMPKADAQAWASQLTPSGMERKLRKLEVWVAELDGGVVGWGAIRGDTLVRTEASSNAREFYLRRGYQANGPQTPNGAWPIAKELPQPPPAKLRPEVRTAARNPLTTDTARQLCLRRSG